MTKFVDKLCKAFANRINASCSTIYESASSLYNSCAVMSLDLLTKKNKHNAQFQSVTIC